MSGFRSYRWALVAAHPGHELRVFHFLESARPLVVILTDGSGGQGVSRLHQTTQLLVDVGAQPSGVYGRFTDREIYEGLMAGDASRLLDITRELTAVFDEHGISAVLTDAAEGYNPVHDVCRSVAAAAARRLGPRAPHLYEVDLVGPPDGSGEGIRVQLDDDAFSRKLEAVRRYSALAAEAGAAFDRFGVDAFRLEFLRRANTDAAPAPDETPYYERAGEERVRLGLYRAALRYRDHVKPVIEQIEAAAIADADALPLRSLH